MTLWHFVLMLFRLALRSRLDQTTKLNHSWLEGARFSCCFVQYAFDRVNVVHCGEQD